MRHRKRIRLLLLTVLSAVLLYGCGNVRKAADTEDMSENIAVSVQQKSAVDDIGGSDYEGANAEEAEKPAESDDVTSGTEAETQEDIIMIMTVNGTELTAVMEDNSSAEALMELLAEGPLTIEMSDYANMEKVGPIGTDLPRNDEPTTTSAGDLILYLGNSFVIYYASNSWNFTRLGRIQDITANELKELLGDGDVTVTLSLPDQQ